MGHPLDVGAHHHAASEPAAGVAHQHHAHASSPAPQSSTGDAAHVAHAAKHCPHCPGLASTPAHSETGSHVLCSAHDGASDSMPTFAKLLLPKHDSSCMSADLPPPPLLRPPSGPALAHTVPRAYSPVALHVRHCVFLI